MSTESIEAVIQVGALKVTIKTVLNNNASPQYEKIKIENGADEIYLETQDFEQYSSWVNKSTKEEFDS